MWAGEEGVSPSAGGFVITRVLNSWNNSRSDFIPDVKALRGYIQCIWTRVQNRKLESLIDLLCFDTVC